MKIEYEGKLTAGYYNDMEAGHPIFIDDSAVDEIIKDALKKMGLNEDFCYAPGRGPADVNNPLIGKHVKLTLEIED